MLVIGSYIYHWKYKGFSHERINSIKTPNHSITPNLHYSGTKTRVEFNGSCLKQGMVTFNYGKVVNIYIVCEISKSINADMDKYKYSGHGIGNDIHGSFSSPGIGLGRNVIIFGVDMKQSTRIDNRKKDILILGKGQTQELEHTLISEKMYSINFTKHNKKFCLILHYNGRNSYLFF